jgi:hypothetical protein
MMLTRTFLSQFSLFINTWFLGWVKFFPEKLDFKNGQKSASILENIESKKEGFFSRLELLPTHLQKLKSKETKKVIFRFYFCDKMRYNNEYAKTV